MTDIPVISPDGQSGTIPEEYKDQALSQGYSLEPSPAEKLEGTPISAAEALFHTHDPSLSLYHAPPPEVEKVPDETDKVPISLPDHWKQAIKGNEDYQGSIQKIIGSTTPMTDLISQAVSSHQDNINSGAAKMLGSLHNNETLQHKDVIDDDLQSWLPDDVSGQSKVNQFRTLAKTVGQSSEMVANRLGNLTQPISAEGLDQTAQAYNDHQTRMLKVLQIVLPKDNSLQENDPFNPSGKTSVHPVTEATARRTLTVMGDPTKLYDLVQSNTINPKDVAVASAVSPDTVDKMRLATIQEMIKQKPDLTYQHKLSLSYLLGKNVDDSLNQVQQLQSVYPPPQPAVMPGKGGQKSMSPADQKNLSDSYLNTSQKANQGS